MSNTTEDETTVDDSYSVTVPASVRAEAGLEAGDKLRWHVTDDGDLEGEVVKHRRGAFSELDPVEAGVPTNAAEDHDAILVAYMRRTGSEYVYSFDDDSDAIDGITRLNTADNPY